MSFVKRLATWTMGMGCAVPVWREWQRWATQRTMPDPWAGTPFRFSDEAGFDVEVGDGGQVHVARRGDRPKVLFIHGWGASMNLWAFVAELVEGAGFPCAAMDLRGHGASSAIPRGADLDLLVEDTVTVLQALEGDGIVLVGHSIGGVIVQALAVRRPDVLRRHVAGIVLVNTTARGSSISFRSRFMALLAGSRLFARIGGTPLGIALLVRRSFPSVVPASALVAAREVFVSGRFDDRAGFNLRRRVSNLSADLASIDVPVTVLAGTTDPLTPLEEAVVIADAVPASRLRVLVRTGHMAPLERPAEVAGEIIRMARRCRPGLSGPSTTGENEWPTEPADSPTTGSFTAIGRSTVPSEPPSS